MSRAGELLSSISGKGTKLWVHCGRLHYLAPEGGLSSCEVDILENHARDILSELTKEQKVDANSTSTESWSTIKIAPLTFQQEFALKYAGGRFFKAFAVRLAGALDIHRLSDSLGDLVRRHEALRTRIVAIETVLTQQIQRSELPLQVLDLISSTESNIEEGVQSHVRAFIDEWLHAGETAFAALLLKLAEQDNVLVILWDHLLQDPASEAIGFRELWRLYQATPDARMVLLSKEPTQYSGYAKWQRAAYADWDEKYGLYWERRLRGAVPLRLPMEIGLGELERTAWLDVALGQTLSHGLHHIAQRSGVPLPLLTLSLVAIAFRDRCDQECFTIPMSFSGRYHSKHLEVIGYLPNVLPLTIEVHDGLAFTDLCTSVSKQFFSAIERLDIGKIVGESIQGLFSGPLFQWFPWNPLDPLVPAPGEWDAQKQALSIVPFTIPQQPRKGWTRPTSFSMRIALWNTIRGIVGLAQYRTDLLSEGTSEKFFHNVRLIGERAVRDPGVRVGSLRQRSE